MMFFNQMHSFLHFFFRPFNPSLRPVSKPLHPKSYPLPRALSSSGAVGSTKSMQNVGGNKSVKKSQGEKKSENPRETEEKVLVL